MEVTEIIPCAKRKNNRYHPQRPCVPKTQIILGFSTLCALKTFDKQNVLQQSPLDADKTCNCWWKWWWFRQNPVFHCASRISLMIRAVFSACIHSRSDAGPEFPASASINNRQWRKVRNNLINFALSLIMLGLSIFRRYSGRAAPEAQQHEKDDGRTTDGRNWRGGRKKEHIRQLWNHRWKLSQCGVRCCFDCHNNC